MALKVVAWDDANNRLVRTDKNPADITGGGGPSGGSGGAIPDFVQAMSEVVSAGETSLTVVYTAAFTNLSYSLQVNFTNLVDSDPVFQPLIITQKTTTGFTATWPSPLETANYRVDYQAVVPYILYSSNSEDITNATTSKATAKPYSGSLPFTSSFINTTDAVDSLIFQPEIVVAGSQFTAAWSTPVNTANYDLEWNTIDVTSPERKSSIVPVSAGVTSISVTFVFPTLYSSSYTLIPRFENVVDSSPLIQPITVTSKSLSGFTCKWNMPTDSVNYRISWILNTEA